MGPIKKILRKAKKEYNKATKTPSEIQRKFGTKVGKNVLIIGTIDQVHPELITIEDDVTIAAGSAVLVHGRGIKPKRIMLKKNCYIGYGAIVLNSSVGKNSMVGAGSVVTKDVPDNEVWVGNPAKFLRKVKKKEHES